MSKTSIKERNKAIRLAWEREQRLVQEGKGTRDWTKEQQEDILNPDKGKAYDNQGSAFEGQHMKSAAEYPEYQGEPDNIQFLTKEEHLEAHKGSWQNPTNWYYDPVIKEYHDFGEGEIIPCKIIELSDPIVSIDSCNIDTAVESTDQPDKQTSSGTDPPIKDTQHPVVEDTSVRDSVKSSHRNQISQGNVIDGLKNVANAVKEFSDKHPVLTTIAEVGLGLAVTAVAGKAIDSKTNQSGSTSRRLLNNQALKDAAETVVNVASKFDFKKSESALKQLGYAVTKNIGLSDVDRQKILQDAISNGIMSKEAICAFLENNINLHKNQNTFTEAVGKWMADLAYVREML